MADLAVQSVVDGLNTLTYVGATPTGNAVPNSTGDVIIHAKNTGGNAIAISATAYKSCDQGVTHNLAVSVDGNTEKFLKLHSRLTNPATGKATLTYDNSRSTAATGTLTISDAIADGATITIGGRIYEVDSNNAITASHVRVDTSGGNTAAQTVTALVAAITGDASAVVTAVDGVGDTVVVTAKVAGSVGNAIATTCSGANLAWGNATLQNGADALTLAAFHVR